MLRVTLWVVPSVALEKSLDGRDLGGHRVLDVGNAGEVEFAHVGRDFEVFAYDRLVALAVDFGVAEGVLAGEGRDDLDLGVRKRGVDESAGEIPEDRSGHQIGVGSVVDHNAAHDGRAGFEFSFAAARAIAIATSSQKTCRGDNEESAFEIFHFSLFLSQFPNLGQRKFTRLRV